MKKNISTLLFVLFSGLLAVYSNGVKAQATVTMQALPYSQDFSGLAASSTTFPAGWTVWKMASAIPTSFSTAVATSTAKTLSASATNATAAANALNYGGSLGWLSSTGTDCALALGLNTTGTTGIQISYEISTVRITSTSVVEQCQLQWATSYNAATWTTVTGTTYSSVTTPTQITGGPTKVNSQTFTVTLPSGCDNQGTLYLRWVDLTVGTAQATTSANSFTLDNIVVCKAPTTYTLSGTNTICSGSSATLTLSGNQTGVSYQLYNGASTVGSPITGSNTWSVSAAGTYTVQTTTANNYCANTMTGSPVITVNTKSADPTSAGATTTSINYGSSTALSLSGGGGGTGETIKWYTGSCGGTLAGTGNSLSVSPSTSTTYWGRYEDGSPCSYNSTCQSVAISVTNFAPTLTTTTISTITYNSATSGGNISSDGGSAITERGVVYSTSSNPTTADSKVIDGSVGTGSFSSDITGLTTGITYHVRAYAINGIGTSYGVDRSFTTASLTASPSITAASGATVDNSFDITFTDDAASTTWRGLITSVEYGSTTLTLNTDYTISAGKITLIPSGSALSGLRTAGTQNVTVKATDYTEAVVSQTIAAGAATQLIMKTDPVTPASNGAVFATQPAVYVKDQYNNLTAGTVAAAVGAGSWTIGGTTSVAAVNGTVTYSNLTASSYAAVTGATITFSLGGLNVSSASFDLAIPAPPALTAAVGATVDNNFNVTFTDNPVWRSNITAVSYNANVLTLNTDYTITAGTITLIPSGSATSGLRTSGSKTLLISSTGYADVSVTQAIAAGVPNKLVMKAQPGAPALNGGLFSPQPAINVRDQYGNATTSNASVTATVGSGSWTILGTVTKTASNGAITWTDLVATSAAAVTGATITFTSLGLTAVTCSTFNLPTPSAATTYYWVGGSAAVQNWNASVWSTTKGGTAVAGFSPLTTDVYIFDGSNVGAGATGNITVTSPTTNLNVGQIVLQNGANVTLSQSTSRTFNINGGTGADLSIDATSTLSTSGSSTTINLLTGTTGSIYGKINLGAGSSAHTLIVADAGALVFNNHSQISCKPGSSSIPFGTGTNGAVIFASGSTLTNISAGDPFGGSGHSVVTFQSGSTYEFQTGVGAALDGRTFANLLFTGAASTSQPASTIGFTCDTFTVNSAFTLNMVGTGTSHIKGNLSVLGGGGLVFGPTSASTVRFDGTVTQTIFAAGTLSFGPNQTVAVANNISLGSNFTSYGTLNFVSGSVTVGANTLTVGNITGSSNLIVSTNSNIGFNGSTGSTLVFSNGNTIKSLTFGGTGTVSLGNDLNIITLLSLSGTGSKLDINSHKLTLKSSAAGTAEVDQVKGTIVDGLVPATNVTVERYIPQGKRNYRDLGPAVANAGSVFANWQENGAGSAAATYGVYITGKTGTPGYAAFDAASGFDYTTNGNTTPSLYTCVGSNWAPVTVATGGTKGLSLDPFQGLRLVVRGSRNFNMGTNPANMLTATTLRATGSLVTGTVTFNAINNGGTVAGNYSSSYGLTNGGGWSFIANPYACPIGWDKILADNAGNAFLNNTYYFLDPTFQSAGLQRYVTVRWDGTNATVVNRPAGVATDAACLNIQGGQGFWVYHDATSTPTVVIKEADKTVGGIQTAVFRTKASNKLSAGIWKDIDGLSTNMDEAIATFDNNYKKSIGAEDAMKLMNGGESISITEANTDLSIDGLSLPSAGDAIALKLGNITANIIYKLTVDATQFSAPGLEAFIKDAYLNTMVPVTTVVSFKPTTDAATYQNRFSVVFKQAKVVPAATATGKISVYPNPVTNNTVTLQTANVAAGKYNVVLINSLGQEVFNTTINHTAGSTTETINMNKMITGLYTVALKSVDGKVVFNTELIAK